MNRATQVTVPTLVRVKPGALGRLGIYLKRAGHARAAVVVSHGLGGDIVGLARSSLDGEGIESVSWLDVEDASFERATALFTGLAGKPAAVVGVGGGKALDVAKYVAFLARLPYYAVPTSLSNDGFSSPQSSLTVAGRRRSLAASVPYGVVVDTAVCLAAPRLLTLSGVGDLMAKLTALDDWKLAFHRAGEPVDDFAALLSDGTVHAFLSRPAIDEEGVQMLASALMLNGLAMEVCGSSRPASGSEHLISHALDGLSARPRLHGLQVGVATYLVSLLQGNQSERIADVFERVGFWDAVAADPFDRGEWLEAVRRAPAVKSNFFTVLSTRDVLPEVERHLRWDERLARCFVG